ncbi:MAG: carboxymuconolactone decarboxylase family protein [Cyclobacteriaceae bacterium]
MTRLEAINPEETTGSTSELFAGIKSKLGVVPNMMRTMGNSPALLEAYLNYSEALGHGTLGAKLGELIALVVAEANQCQYCASAHTFIGKKMAGLDERKMAAARVLDSIDPKTDAALRFAYAQVEKRGRVSDEDIEHVRDAGFTDGEIGEIIGHVALNTLTNYFNNTALTEIDFPEVQLVSKSIV